MRIPALCSSVLLCLSVSVQAQQKVPFTAERSWEIQRIGNPTITPNGRFAIAPVSRFVMSEDKTLTDLWLFATDGSEQRQLTTHVSNESAPAISPDGRSVVFTAQREDDKAPQLYLMPLTGGEARRLTQIDTGVQSPKWFKDGQRIAFVSRVFSDLPLSEQNKRLEERSKSKMTARVWEGTSVTAWDQYLDEREFHIFMVNVGDIQVQPLTLGTGLSLPRWAVQGTDTLFALSPDDQELAFTADSDPSNNSNMDVFTLTIGTNKPINRTPNNQATDINPSYSPDGRYLSYNQQRIHKFYADKNRFMLHDRRDGTVRELYSDFDRSMPESLQWSADGRRAFGALDDAGTVRIYEFPINGKPRKVTGESSFGGLTLSPNGVLVGLRQSFIEPPTLVRIDTRNGQNKRLSTINDELLAGTDLGTFESVTYQGADGKNIQMWVNYPPGFDKSKKYPLFILIHGGPHVAITNSMHFRWNAQVFGSWGYVTAWPNFHGSSGFGQDFTDSINPNWTDKPYEDVIKAAEWFTKQSWIDRDRMVAGGGSYGGYLTSVLLGREHPFRALVAHAAVYNLYTQYASDYSTEMPRFGGFWEEKNRAMIEKTSPHYHAANFKTPTLVIHGQLDYRVPVNHGQELYQTLLMKGVPTRYVYFPNENHWILKPQNSVYWYSEVKNWFDKYNVSR